MAKDMKWVMVRLRRATQARLRRYRSSQWELAMRDLADVPESGRPGGGMPSWDWVVNRLLDMIDAHRVRARRQRQEKRAKVKKAAPTTEDSGNGK